MKWIRNTLKARPIRPKARSKTRPERFTGDARLQAEGKMDKAKGDAHSAMGDAKDAVKHAKE